MITRVDIAEDAWARIRLDVAARLPDEACGALLGRIAADGTRHVRAARPVPNQASDPARTYLVPGRRVLELERAAARAGFELLGFYHSHPAGAAEASPFDRDAAWPWYVYLIVPGPTSLPPRCWIGAATGGLAEVAL